MFFKSSVNTCKAIGEVNTPAAQPQHSFLCFLMWSKSLPNINFGWAFNAAFNKAVLSSGLFAIIYKIDVV